jgi:hypothetical protein
MERLTSTTIELITEWLDGISIIRLSSASRSWRCFNLTGEPFPLPNVAVCRFVRALNIEILLSRSISCSINRLKEFPYDSIQRFSRLETLTFKAKFEAPPSKRIGMDMILSTNLLPPRLTNLVISTQIGTVIIDTLPQQLTQLKIRCMNIQPISVLHHLPPHLTSLKLNVSSKQDDLPDLSQTNLTSINLGPLYGLSAMSLLPRELQTFKFDLKSNMEHKFDLMPRTLTRLRISTGPHLWFQTGGASPDLSLLPATITDLSIPWELIKRRGARGKSLNSRASSHSTLSSSRMDSEEGEEEEEEEEYLIHFLPIEEVDLSKVPHEGVPLTFPSHLTSLLRLTILFNQYNTFSIPKLPETLHHFGSEYVHSALFQTKLDRWLVGRSTQRTTLTLAPRFISSIKSFPPNLTSLQYNLFPPTPESLIWLPPSLIEFSIGPFFPLNPLISYLSCIQLPHLASLHLPTFDFVATHHLEHLPRTIHTLTVRNFDFDIPAVTPAQTEVILGIESIPPSADPQWPPHLTWLTIIQSSNLTEQNLHDLLPTSISTLIHPGNKTMQPLSTLRRGLILATGRPVPLDHIKPKPNPNPSNCSVS